MYLHWPRLAANLTALPTTYFLYISCPRYVIRYLRKLRIKERTNKKATQECPQIQFLTFFLFSSQEWWLLLIMTKMSLYVGSTPHLLSYCTFAVLSALSVLPQCQTHTCSNFKLQCFSHKTHVVLLHFLSHLPVHIWNNHPAKDVRRVLFSLPSKASFSSTNIPVKHHCSSPLSVCTVCLCAFCR